MKIYELMPVGSVKSFYGKAIVVVDDNGNETLKSYQTDIIRRDADGSLHRLWDGWSATTGRHIFAFCGYHKKNGIRWRLNDELL